MAIQDIPPDLIELLAAMQQGGVASLQQPILNSQLEDARAMRDTEMPKATRALGQDRFGTIIGAAHPMEYAASTLRQILGGQQARGVQDQMMQGVDKEGDAFRAMMMAKLLREFPGQGAAPAPEAPFPYALPGGVPYRLPEDAPVAPARRAARRKAAAPAVAPPPTNRGGFTGEW